LLRELPEALSFPMSNSVACTEDVQFVAEAPEGYDGYWAEETAMRFLTAHLQD